MAKVTRFVAAEGGVAAAARFFLIAPAARTDLASILTLSILGGRMGLGDLQQMTMLAVARVGRDAYGSAIRDELREVAGRSVSVPTVYVTLVRLEDQGLVASSEAPPSGERGGRPRRVFRLTPSGWEALQESRATLTRMWEGVAQP